MERNSLSNLYERKSIFTVRNILKFLLLLCMILVFCPTFLVSCSGYKDKDDDTVDISIMDIVSGNLGVSETSSVLNDLSDLSEMLGGENYAQSLADATKPQPVAIVYFLLPLAIFGILFVKNFQDRNIALIALIGTVIDFILWLFLKSFIEKEASQYYCTVRTTIWFLLNMIFLAFIFFLCLLVILRIVYFNTGLVDFISKAVSWNQKRQGANPPADSNYNSVPRNPGTPPTDSSFNGIPRTPGTPPTDSSSNGIPRTPDTPPTDSSSNGIPRTPGTPPTDSSSNGIPKTPDTQPTVYQPQPDVASSGTLQFIAGELQGNSIPLQNHISIIIGRDSSASNIILSSKDISRRHCEVQYNAFDRCYYIRDYSSYGVFVNGQPLEKNIPVPCQIGDEVSLASGENKFVLK